MEINIPVTIGPGDLYQGLRIGYIMLLKASNDYFLGDSIF